jgi:alpha-acetolactate decarboxylase
MPSLKRLILITLVATGLLFASQVYAGNVDMGESSLSHAQDHWDGQLVQYGTMHEAIGQKQHEGRIALAEILERPHFYGVAALEGLKGEATFFDSDATITVVAENGRLEPINRKELQATLLAGAYVPVWSERTIEDATPPAELDNLIRDAALSSGFDVSKAFVFTLEGEFSEVKLHVINGACPMHARMKQIELPDESKPFEGRYNKINGKAIGIYANNAVGILTHPATSTHIHLIFKDETSGEMVTGHVEELGLLNGVKLQLPLKI